MAHVKVTTKDGKVIEVLPKEVPILKKAGLLAKQSKAKQSKAKQSKETGKTKELKTQTETK